MSHQQDAGHEEELGPIMVSQGAFEDDDADCGGGGGGGNTSGTMGKRTSTHNKHHRHDGDEEDEDDDGDMIHATSSSFRKRKSTIMANRRGSMIGGGDDRGSHSEHYHGQSMIEMVDEGGNVIKKQTLKEVYIEMSLKEFSCSHRFFNIIHGDPVVSPDDIIATAYHTILIFAIIISILILIISSDPAFYEPDEAQSGTFFVLEAVCVGLFSIDIILQAVSAEAWEHIIHMQFFIDTLSVVGFYLEIILAAAGTSASTSGLVVLRIFRLTRILRVLKVSSAANAMELVFTTLVNSKQGLLMLISLISVVTLLGGAVLFFLEQQYSEFDQASLQWYRENGELSPFQSVPATFWFVVATITTIGYGDHVPYSIVGKSITMILMLFGVLLLSFPNILIGAQFQLIHSTFQRAKARTALGRVFRKARMIIRFVRMWREYSVKGTIENLIEDNPTQEIPDEEEDEGDLDLFGNDEEEEEEDGRNKLFVGDDDTNGANGDTSSSSDNFAVENLLHVPESMRKRNRHYVNFWFYPGEFPAVDFSVGEQALANGLFHKVFIGGQDSGGSRFSALQLVQRLLENFSGCATADELFESFALYPPYPGANIRRSDIILMLLLLGKSRHMFLFILSRTDDTYLAAFTKSGLAMLRTFPESGLVTCPCFRSINQAGSIWKRTTKKSFPLENPSGFDGYPKWHIAQSLVPDIDVTRFTENLRLTTSRKNHVVFLKSGFVPTYPLEKHLGSEYGFGTGLGPTASAVAAANRNNNGAGHLQSSGLSPGCNALVPAANESFGALSKEQAAMAMNQMLARSLVQQRSQNSSQATTPQTRSLDLPSGGGGGGGGNFSLTAGSSHGKHPLESPSFNSSLSNNPFAQPGASTPPPAGAHLSTPPPPHMVPSIGVNDGMADHHNNNSMTSNNNYNSKNASFSGKGAATGDSKPHAPLRLDLAEMPAIAISTADDCGGGGGTSPAADNGVGGGASGFSFGSVGAASSFGGAEQFAFLGDAGGSSATGRGKCPHCVHCMTQEALLPQQIPDSMWRAKKELALSNFVWKQDEETIELQIEYLQRWLKIMRHVKHNKPELVQKPPEDGLLKSNVIRTESSSGKKKKDDSFSSSSKKGDGNTLTVPSSKAFKSAH